MVIINIKAARTVHALILLIMLFMVHPVQTHAAITGACSTCHTMHNSQNGDSMAYTATGEPWEDDGPFDYLTRGSCMGCHGMGTVNKIETVGDSDIPQVYHIGGTPGTGDLAGGNFAYITGAKGTASDAKGHNVVDLGVANMEDTLEFAPGYFPLQHFEKVSNETLTCAGSGGCHGNRGHPGVQGMGAGIEVLKGAHHQNEGGQLNSATEIYNSFRFLRGVKGYENNGTFPWENKNSTNHNEYFGASTPADIGCDATTCHSSNGVIPPNNTMSGFCATCHGSFHVLGDADEDIEDEGIGGTLTSPFTRHPTDILIPNTEEYANYISYSVEAPVARTSVPTGMSSSVNPGSDVVMCLSCHMAHASNYEDMLRWDYHAMISAGGGSGGCFTCHTEKN